LEKSRWKRLLSITIDRNDIVAWEKELDDAMKLFTVRFWDSPEFLLKSLFKVRGRNG